ncbi:chorismate mutase 2-like [Mangifera indica]|uniref:chorismate mutase 2-like n=1 Tax=Mangifera indica TaxID=29780 RepID=UPI001CFB141C|nr:chorismate mutase 2-like [Mangifera indica]
MFFFFFPCPHQQQTNKQTSKISNMASYFPLFPIASLYSSFINLSIYASPDANMAKTEPGSFSEGIITLESVRESLIRQEDTIVFNLIERARYPRNSPLYNQSYSIPGFSGSLFQYIVSQSENLYARAGRYENPEENPFFPDNLPGSLLPPYNYPKILHPPAASININSNISDKYFNQLLPVLVSDGDDGNYASTATIDLLCLQALSRRIHYGKFVAEVKYREAPHQYEPLIRAKNSDALMKLLTFEKVEEEVKKRVEKKAMIFGQEVTLSSNDTKGKRKIDPSVLSKLYADWVIPLTKVVEVEYLLHRLD